MVSFFLCVNVKIVKYIWIECVENESVEKMKIEKQKKIELWKKMNECRKNKEKQVKKNMKKMWVRWKYKESVKRMRYLI
jgi:hypothetical protein